MGGHRGTRDAGEQSESPQTTWALGGPLSSCRHVSLCVVSSVTCYFWAKILPVILPAPVLLIIENRDGSAVEREAGGRGAGAQTLELELHLHHFLVIAPVDKLLNCGRGSFFCERGNSLCLHFRLCDQSRAQLRSNFPSLFPGVARSFPSRSRNKYQPGCRCLRNW